MNQKEIKEIAGIIKDNFHVVVTQDVANDLANYFEKTDCRKCKGEGTLYPTSGFICPYCKGKRNFNKKQFLIDCGVSE